MIEKKKKISIGVEDFKTIIDKNGYFVDKTLLIRDIIESNTLVSLFTRPRRFGKTLNQFMIRRFFEDERTEQGEKIENGYLFDGLAISSCGEEILKHRQQYPVIFVSMKSGRQPSYEMAYACLLDEICKEFTRHRYVLDSELITLADKKRYENLMNREAAEAEYAKAFAFLSECLSKYHGRKVFILIDEYDVPLENAHFQGFYDEMTGFIRSLFESALKTNPYLEKGIITGCLRISKESIFTGLNNLRVYSLISNQYCDKFGFTPEEVMHMLEYYGLGEYYPILHEWYDGYKFGTAEIYNPWSILCYMEDALSGNFQPRPYWSNTSSNSIIRELVEGADDETRKDLETLMDGSTIEKPIHEDITYGDIYRSQDNLWNFLFFTGYLKAIKEQPEGNQIYLEMSIPNLEIASVYENSISYWFDKKMERTDKSALIRALERGDCEAAEDFINRQLMDTISYFDYAESYYHGFMTGLLKGSGKYIVQSNRESGDGRPDIVLKTANVRKGRVIILEFKIASRVADMESKCTDAAEQIEKKRYAEPFLSEGYPEIDKYAVCFCRKDCIVRKV